MQMYSFAFDGQCSYDISVNGLWYLMQWIRNFATRAENASNFSFLSLFKLKSIIIIMERRNKRKQVWNASAVNWPVSVSCECTVCAHRQHVDRSLARTLHSSFRASKIYNCHSSLAIISSAFFLFLFPLYLIFVALAGRATRTFYNCITE